ncbi:MAG: hypothetical protein GWN47_04340 [Woeseiaceae bacterium]|nr:hypothetical protein [Woeseiaceae bacterium]
MKNLTLIIACALGVTACASSQPEQAAPSAVPATGSSAVQSGTQAANDTGESLDVVEVPAAAKTATAPDSGKRDELVCWRERSLGSHRFEKICRFRSEIEDERKDTQRSMRKAQRGGPTINSE